MRLLQAACALTVFVEFSAVVGVRSRDQHTAVVVAGPVTVAAAAAGVAAAEVGGMLAVGPGRTAVGLETTGKIAVAVVAVAAAAAVGSTAVGTATAGGSYIVSWIGRRREQRLRWRSAGIAAAAVASAGKRGVAEAAGKRGRLRGRG